MPAWRPEEMRGKVLIIAGSDSGGGAGIQADIKTVTVLGGFATTAISALTVQNTLGVSDIMPVPVSFVRAQIRCVLEDIGTDAFKSGMLDSAEIISVVSDEIAFGRQRSGRDLPFVLDPVMVAKGGSRLLQAEAENALKAELMPLATLITPNIPEAEVLTDRRIACVDDMVGAGKWLNEQGAHSVLVKGGHLEGDLLTDVLVTADGQVHFFSDQRIETRHTHGTGCTLSSAIATLLAQGMPLVEAVRVSRLCLRHAIDRAPGFGSGAGPLWHQALVDGLPVS